MRGGIQRGFARAGDRARRQARYRVGIIRSWGLKILTRDLPIVALSHAVNHGGIGLQTHTYTQAIDKYRRHAIALFRYRRLFFNNRRHGHQLVFILIRQAVHSPFPGFIDLGNHFLVRTLEDGDIGRVGGIHPGVRPEPAFNPLWVLQRQRFRHGGVAIVTQRVFDIRRFAQLLQIIAQTHTFNEAQRELRLFAAGQQLHHVANGHLRRKAIGPGFEVGKLRLKAQQPLEHPRTIDHLLGVQLVAQRQSPGARF